MYHKISFFLLSFFIICGLLFFTSQDQQSGIEKIKVDENYKVYAPEVPEKFELFDQQIPLYKTHVKEKFDRELLVNTYWHSNTILGIKRSARWFPIIEQILKEQDVPDDFKYLALIESGLDQVVSPAGARGFWQFMKSSAKSYGLEISDHIDERYHVEKATKAACAYLKHARKQFSGDWILAAASYNMGVSGLKRRLTKQEQGNYFDLLLNSETSRYVYRIMAAKLIHQHRTDYGFYLRIQDMYKPYVYQEVSVDSSVENFVKFARQFSITYRDLKSLNPWLRDDYLKNESKKSYKIKIPVL